MNRSIHRFFHNARTVKSVTRNIRTERLHSLLFIPHVFFGKQAVFLQPLFLRTNDWIASIVPSPLFKPINKESQPFLQTGWDFPLLIPFLLQHSSGILLFYLHTHNTLPHYFTNMADGIRTIFFQPFRNNSHKPMNIKRHDITSFRLHNLKAF